MAPLFEQDPRANAFTVEGTGAAALLVHGFTGTPAELLPIANHLSREFGWHVRAPRLPGHGTTPEDLAKQTADVWAETVDIELAQLRKRFSDIHLLGLSMGASLAVDAYRRQPEGISSLALLAPSIWLRKLYKRIGIKLFRWPLLSRLKRSASKEKPIHPDHITYQRYPTKALAEFEKVMHRARALPQLKAPPTFICYSRVDTVVHPKSARFLVGQLRASRLQLVVLERSMHVLTLGEDREQLFSELLNFYRGVKS